MKAKVKSVLPTQKGEICVIFEDAKILGRRLINNTYVIAEDDNITLSIKEWRFALHNVVKGNNIGELSAQKCISTVLDSINTDRRISAATALINDAIIDIEAVEFAAGEEIAEGYVAQYDGVRYNVNEVVLSATGNMTLKLQWGQTMGLSPEYLKML